MNSTIRKSLLYLCIITLGLIPEKTVAAAVSTTLVTGGLSSPLYMTYAPDDPTRLFVVQRGGQIRIVKSGLLNATPFLDITAKLVSGSERGLLGLAFHPDYQSNGYLFVCYTRTPDGASVIARYSVSGNPDSAVVASELILRTVSQPEPNHNGGCLQFGADGMLYIGMGDGGGANDQHGTIGNAQDPGTLLGKMLRLDVDNPPTYIPADNPWVGVQTPVDTLDELWAIGLRNPWRFSFDRMTGDLYIADVGQGQREEVNVQSVSSPGGENYGWRCMEGTLCTANGGCSCASAALTDPVHEYTHASGCSITGGYVYRGCAIPELTGQYFFGDYCSGRIWSIVYDGSSVIDTTEWTATLDPTNIGFHISSFGEDYYGELYICDLDGALYKIVSDAPAPCGPCDCPYQSDFDEDNFLTALDLGNVIDILFAGADDLQDPDCPHPRADFDCDGFSTALDLGALIDHLFAGGGPPCEPCAL